LPPARTMAEMERAGGAGNGEGVPASVGRVGQPVPAPSRQYRTVQGGELFQVQVPSNWQAVPSNSSVKYVPQNGYGEYRGQVTLTHGVELGVARASSRDLNEATQTLIQGFINGNEGMQLAGRQQQGRLANRTAIRTPLIGRSALGGGERVDVYTTLLRDGNLFYYLSVVPEREEGNYAAAFERVAQTIRLNDR
jgi:beta-barrel assembly-enhancing protease